MLEMLYYSRSVTRSGKVKRSIERPQGRWRESVELRRRTLEGVRVAHGGTISLSQPIYTIGTVAPPPIRHWGPTNLWLMSHPRWPCVFPSVSPRFAREKKITAAIPYPRMMARRERDRPRYLKANPQEIARLFFVLSIFTTTITFLILFQNSILYLFKIYY